VPNKVPRKPFCLRRGRNDERIHCYRNRNKKEILTGGPNGKVHRSRLTILIDSGGVRRTIATATSAMTTAMSSDDDNNKGDGKEYHHDHNQEEDEEDIEIILNTPNLNSDIPHEILGVATSTTTTIQVSEGHGDHEKTATTTASNGSVDVDDSAFDAIIERAYRDLARKYHPNNSHSITRDSNNKSSRNGRVSVAADDDDDDKREKSFRKISQAYAALTSNSSSNVAAGGGGGSSNSCKQVIRLSDMDEVMSTGEAQRVYESKFGPYREIYYSEAGMIGIPYAPDLKEMWTGTTDGNKIPLRDRLSFVLFALRKKTKKATAMTAESSSTSPAQQEQRVVRLNLFRTILLKKDMNFMLCVSEILLTWTVIAFCKFISCDLAMLPFV
jgi:hypothetical protein